MSDPHRTTVWPALQAHDPDLVIRTLVALGFEETAAYRDEAGVVQHAQLDWPEGGGVMLGCHKPEGPFKAEAQPIKGSYSMDPAVFTDDDGQSYMFFGGIWGGQLQRWSNGQYDPNGSKTDLGKEDQPALMPRSRAATARSRSPARATATTRST